MPKDDESSTLFLEGGKQHGCQMDFKNVTLITGEYGVLGTNESTAAFTSRQ